MRKHKFLLVLPLLGLALSGCNGAMQDMFDGPTTDDRDPKILEIYKLYQANGGTLSYDEWLKTIKGEKGDPGTPGQDGKDGQTPYIGENGHWWIGEQDTGVIAEGKDGKDGQPGSNGQDGAPGQNGKDGSDGQNGQDGKNGSSLLTGDGAPEASLGKNDDTYIDLETWDFYKKENNNWVLKGNLKGKDAPQAIHNGSEGLYFYPLEDGKYAQSIGQANLLKEVTFASTYNGQPVTAIVFGLEYAESNVEKVIVPEGIETIGYGAFARINLQSISLPKSLKVIREDAFYSYESLTEVNYAGTVEEFESNNAFDIPWYSFSNLPHITCSDGNYVSVNPQDEITKKTINVWHCFGNSLSAILTAAVSAYKTKYPGYNINLVNMGNYDNCYQSVVNGIPTDNYPDAFVSYGDNIANLIELDKIQNISTLVNADTAFVDDMPEALLKDGQHYQVEGQYSLPLYTNTEALYYNKKILNLDLSSIDNTINGGNPIDENYLNSLTWDELFTHLLPAVKEYNTGAVEKLYKGHFPLLLDYEQNFLYFYAKQNGLDIDGFNAETHTPEIRFNTPEMKSLMTQLQGYYLNGLFSTRNLSGTGYGNNELIAENILFSLSTTGGSSYYGTADFTAGVARCPGTNGSNYLGLQRAPQFSVLKHDKFNDEHAEQAFNFYKILLNCSNDLFVNAGFMPMTNSQRQALNTFHTTNSEMFEETPRLKVMYDTSLSYDTSKLVSNNYYKGSSSTSSQLNGLLSTCLRNNDLANNIDSIFTSAYNNIIFNL